MSAESNVAVVQCLNSIKPLNLTKLHLTFKRCRKLIEELLPATISLNFGHHDDYLAYNADVNLSTVKQISIKASESKENEQILLAKEHWRLKSEISAPTFFENNYGSKSLGGVCFQQNQQILSLFGKNISPQLIFARGFKTRRSDPEVRATLFGRKHSEGTSGGTPELKLGGIKEK